MGRTRYSDEDRAKALAILDACGGNFLRASKDSGVPRATLQEWAAGRVPDSPVVMPDVPEPVPEVMPDPPKRTERTTIERSAPDWAPRFFEALREEGTIYHACLKAKCSRSNVYQRRGNDPAFAAELSLAIEDGTDALEREGIRRGSEGYDEPVIHQGRLMGGWFDQDGAEVPPGTPGGKFFPLTVRKYSDSVLIALLKGRRYFSRHEHTGPGGGAIPVDHSGLVTYEHRLDAAALRAFNEDMARAGLADLSADGRQQRLDTQTADETA